MEQFEGDRLGLILAFWGLGLALGRPLISQTDYTEDGQTFGMPVQHRPAVQLTALSPPMALCFLQQC